MLFLLFLLVSAFCSAKQVDDKTYVIGVEAIDYYPLYDFDYQNTVKPSFTRDLLSGFFESKDYSYRFLPLPIKRFNRWYVEQNIDFKFPDNIRWRDSEKIKLDITYSEPVLYLMAGAYVLKKNAKINREQVKKLGTMTGFYPTLWVNEINSGHTKLVESVATRSIVKHLLYGNVDATNIDQNVIAHNQRKLNSNSEIVLNQNIHHEKYAYFFSSIQYPEIIKEFNQYLRDNKQKVDALKQKYHLVED
ncbi:hypothetical protein [Thalassotalea sp. PLHSN55]|uniref:hypothetical protein n=1 Tax=Thalassotalea sp. PLHSN55 TaxID=3435888 RepID=UPI003F85834C